MGRFDMDIPDDVLGLEKLLDGELGKEMVDAALPTLEDAVKEGYSRHNRKGYLAESVKVHKAKRSGDGYMGYVAPEGNRPDDGKRHGEIAAYLEYGTGHQPSTPVIGPAVKSSEAECVAKMQEVFDRKVGS
jgi:HK97 gp10 family phage protein